ncbi:CAF17-like 4Fe-4S cluster assembly/insertion protein YgfZ [Zavarzinia sp. CC-PAN008]|uniref:CAF17-like 4Fe-4S cluster assembly/insertion protein YgfZ n=1 Tax=Zavarzinia sp. CC-PAN008 TaxID=3243332 RepID=UPI003F748025
MTEAVAKAATPAPVRAVILADRRPIAVAGPEAVSFLQGLISNDVTKVAPAPDGPAARAIYAALLTPQGKYLFDFPVAPLGDRLVLDAEAGRAADLQKRLAIYKLRSKVTLADLDADHAVAALIGPGAAAAIGLDGAAAGTVAPFHGGVAFVDPRLAGLGVRLILPRSALDTALAPFAPATVEDYDAWRLGHGVPDGSRDLAIDKGFLLENNFEELNGVDFDKGCYVGQELTARTKYRGTIRKRLFRVELEDGALPAPGTILLAGGKDAGEMRSGRDRTGLALLRLEEVAAAGGELLAGESRLRAVKPDWVGF